MEGLLMMGGIIAAVFLIGLTIAAFTQVGWFYSILAILLTGSVIYFVRSLWIKAENDQYNAQKKQTALSFSKIIISISVVMIIIGALMFIFCFLMGPTGYADTFTKCGWCGGDGLTSGEICKLCYGGGGARGTQARYTATVTNWLGVLMAAAGTIIIFSTKALKKKYN